MRAIPVVLLVRQGFLAGEHEHGFEWRDVVPADGIRSGFAVLLVAELVVCRYSGFADCPAEDRGCIERWGRVY